ncbi:MAG: hypothetical protein H7X95_06715 [Deltaproteobacteria bacterium]|nr:hypothetical protein [Deltaproteobacteria bacterium]
MIRSVVQKTRAGSIIIFHINARETKTAGALPQIFRQLRARGFHFVHLSTLLASAAPGPTDARVPIAQPGVPADDDAVMPPSATLMDGLD